jgi:DNA-binding CsgD family transcriptional regulator
MELSVRLTDHERDLMQRLSVGRTTEEVKSSFNLSSKELSDELGAIYSKFGIRKVPGAREEAVCTVILGGSIIGPNIRRFSLESLTDTERKAADLLPIFFQDVIIANHLGYNQRETVAELLGEVRRKIGAKTRKHLAAIILMVNIK